MPVSPGWYPDPSDPTSEWFWNGTAYSLHRTIGDVENSLLVTRDTPKPPGGRRPAWLFSWPMIALGLILFLIPGLILLWLRPTSSTKVKAGVTIAAFASVLLIGFLGSPRAPLDPPVAHRNSPSPTESISTPETSAAALPAASSNDASTLSPSPAPPGSGGATASGVVAQAVLALAVKGRAPKTGYARSQFGPAWVDVNRNGCDTRNDMLKANLTNLVMSGPCKVLAGTLPDPYTSRSIEFVYGGTSEVDIDHLVPLSDAWQKGAAQWAYAKRVAFANDPLNLQPTDASTNRQKGDSDAASWLPPAKNYRCAYVARQTAVKTKYQVWVTSAEKAAMLAVLSTCPDQPLPPPGPQPTIASNTGGSPPTAAASPRPVTTRPTTSATDPRFATCKAAKAAGYGPYYQGVDPEYDWYIDRDGDGIDCE